MSEFITTPDSTVKGVFLEAIGKVKNNEMLSLSDLYVGVSFDDLALTVYDDEEAMLAQANIDEWAAFKEDPETFEEHVTQVLKNTLHEKDLKEAMEALDVIRPFAVVLVGEDFEQKEELFRLDDNLVVIEDDFLKNIDQQLDEFLKNLLADV